LTLGRRQRSYRRLVDVEARPSPVDVGLPERLAYRIKCRLLGRPLVTDQLHEQRLANPVAFGVLAVDCISSSAYGTEEILIELLKGGAGLAAFTLVLPLTGVILGILLMLLFSYRQVLTVYTKAGGSYVVARENFGPRIAQIAAVALLIDYIVTVAVQIAAGTVAITSVRPSIGRALDNHGSLVLSLVVLALLLYGNLRGIREAGKSFAFPLYVFIAMAGLVIIACVVREASGHLPLIAHRAGMVTGSRGHGGFVDGVTVFVLLRAFANGGSSVTGFEAISNGVSAFRPPEGRNARKVLLVMACTLAFLVGGVSWVAHITHATPFDSGYPSVISQEGRAAFGHSGFGNVFFYVFQAATALILYTGGNTSFNGFPFLANFVAEDRFLPRQLTRRGHRLVFSNAILLLTAVSAVLLIATNAVVNSLVPFYAIGVFTGFAMAGFGMARHATRHREGRWRYSVAINLLSGIVCSVVVAIFAITKFTEGAWVVVVLFPLMVFALIRLNREYREEAEVLGSIRPEALTRQPNYAHHVVLIFVNELDLAVVRAIRYAQTLKPAELRAIHLDLDSAATERLERLWHQTAQNIALEIVDVPDRRLGRASLELVARETARSGTHVTVILPRRGFAPALGRLLHDRTADTIARIVSRVPRAAATIIPFDTSRPDITTWFRTKAAQPHGDPGVRPSSRLTGWPSRNGRIPAERVGLNGAGPPAGCRSIGELLPRQRVMVSGRIRRVRLQPLADAPMLVCELVDNTGGLELLFYGRRAIPGMVAGATVTASGLTQSHHGLLAIANPRYELHPR
jgi:amino acid transporter